MTLFEAVLEGLERNAKIVWQMGQLADPSDGVEISQFRTDTYQASVLVFLPYVTVLEQADELSVDEKKQLAARCQRMSQAFPDPKVVEDLNRLMKAHK